MSTQSNRLLALDVIRGITIAGMILVNNPGSWQSVYAPLKHAQWNGLTPTDLVFPFFMFIMGVAIHFSLRKFEKLDAAVSMKIIRRTVALFVVGIALDCFSKLCYGTFSLETLRILGVMQRLALAYAGGAFLAIIVPKKYYLGVAGGILLIYVGLLQGFNGYIHSADNLIAMIDVKLLGAGHLIKEAADGGSFAFEPEGLLSTIPCWAHVLLGAYVGSLITNTGENRERVRKIALFGTILLFAGFLLQYLDPINKKVVDKFLYTGDLRSGLSTSRPADRCHRCPPTKRMEPFLRSLRRESPVHVLCRLDCQCTVQPVVHTLGRPGYQHTWFAL